MTPNKEDLDFSIEEMELHLTFVHAFFFADGVTRASLYEALQAAAKKRNLRPCSRQSFKTMIDNLARDIIGPGQGFYADRSTGIRRPIGPEARAVLFDWIHTQMGSDDGRASD